jgi:hypothetical protein
MVKARAKRKPTKRRKTTRTTKLKQVRLSPVGRAIRQKIGELKRLEQTPHVSEAIGKMEESLAQLTQICGDVMIFPAR